MNLQGKLFSLGALLQHLLSTGPPEMQ